MGPMFIAPPQIAHVGQVPNYRHTFPGLIALIKSEVVCAPFVRRRDYLRSERF